MLNLWQSVPRLRASASCSTTITLPSLGLGECCGRRARRPGKMCNASSNTLSAPSKLQLRRHLRPCSSSVSPALCHPPVAALAP